MIVQIQTRLNPMMTIYDTDAPDSQAKGLVQSILNPVVQVKQGDMVLYSYGEPYEDQSGYYLAGIAAFAVLAYIGLRRIL